MLKLQVIVGSTRPGRMADKVLPWVIERATSHAAFAVELLDLRDWPLPMFAEHPGSIGDFKDPTYSDPIVKRWNRKIAESDAYLVVTPEYNHSIPGVLKNAIDSVFVSYAFRNKPIAAVTYSGGLAAGSRAIEHLAHCAIEAEMVPLRNNVLIPYVGKAFDPAGTPLDSEAHIWMGVMLDDLAWWARLLKRGRADDELPPGMFRVLAARSAGNANAKPAP
jgi:NAD(P)H-dependent FMN reductase